MVFHAGQNAPDRAYFSCMRLLTRKKRDREGSTQALLQAAIEVFSTVGYDAATTRAVAKKAGVSEALIQRYFDGKAGLLVAVIESFSSDEIETQLASLPYQPTVREEIEQLMKLFCDQMKQHTPFMRVALSRAIVDPKVGRQLAVIVHGRRLPAIMARLNSYKDRGLLAPDTNIMAMAFGVSSLGFSLGFMAPSVFGMEEARIADFMAYFTKILSSDAQAQATVAPAKSS